MRGLISRTDQPQRPSTSDESDDDDDDFFAHKKRHLSGQVQLEQYLASDSASVASLAAWPVPASVTSLAAWPVLAKVFVRLNTPLPASAACERLFSAAGRIFTSSRARIGAVSFENQLLLKLNGHFRQ